MTAVSRLAGAIIDRLVRNRHRLPRALDRLIDRAAKNPDGFVGQMASVVLGSGSSHVPPATEAPNASIRVYIGPTNYAAQGYLWSRALMEHRPDIGARSMAVELPGTFSFPTDTRVPVAVYNRSTAWQKAEFASVGRFSHVLFEAERPLFGTLFDRDVERESDALRDLGLSTAWLSHGTDARSPRDHLARTPWSPFSDSPAETAQLQADADRNIALLTRTDRPVFVSTPDLLLDLPDAIWCPVVVNPTEWAAARPLLSESRLVVAHVPSMASTKGTHLIDAPIRALESAGAVEYRHIRGVASAQMPAIIGDTDIVLDQFRIGSYGVAACEAMAAGRVVLGHVLPEVRARVRSVTGLELPIVEATPDTIATVLTDLRDDPDRMRAIGLESTRFVAEVHSGARSSMVLVDGWIDIA